MFGILINIHISFYICLSLFHVSIEWIYQSKDCCYNGIYSTSLIESFNKSNIACSAFYGKYILYFFFIMILLEMLSPIIWNALIRLLKWFMLHHESFIICIYLASNRAWIAIICINIYLYNAESLSKYTIE